VQVGEVELEYEASGQGPPVLLIMGIGAQLVLWPDGFVDALAARGYTVIRFDNRDVGLSTKLDHLGVPPVLRQFGRLFAGLPVDDAPYDLSDMARDTAGLIEALGFEDAHVVGASMGGMIAQHLALEHPRRVRTLTSIMSTPGGRRNAIGRPKAFAQLFQKAARNRVEAIENQVRFFRTVGGTGFPLDEAEIRERAGRSWDRSYHPQGFARQMAAILASGDRRRKLRGLQKSTLVIHGSEDPLIPPRAGRATARAIPNAELRIIEGMGHHMPAGTWSRMVDDIHRLARRHDESSSDGSTAA
jgi:pimeloyl-ACP methyl ester carboxylesterase